MNTTQDMNTSTVSINVRHTRGKYTDKEKQVLKEQLKIAFKWLDGFFDDCLPYGHVKYNFVKLLDDFPITSLLGYFPPNLLGLLGCFPITSMNISCGEATIGVFAKGIFRESYLNIITAAHTTLDYNRPTMRNTNSSVKFPSYYDEHTTPHSTLAKLLLVFYVYKAVELANHPRGQGVYVSSFLTKGYQFYHNYLKHLNIYVTELEFSNPNTGNDMIHVTWESRDFILKLLQNEIDLEAFFFDTDNYIKSLTTEARAVVAVKA